MLKHLQTFESFWSKNKVSEEKPYYCKEFNDWYDLNTFVSDGNSPFNTAHYQLINDVGFDKEEKKKFCLFKGDCSYLTNNRVTTFTYEFKKTLGFGLGDNTVTKYTFNINKKETQTEDFFYTMELYLKNEENKYYLCDSLDSCMKKIKEIKKTTMAYA